MDCGNCIHKAKEGYINSSCLSCKRAYFEGTQSFECKPDLYEEKEQVEIKYKKSVIKTAEVYQISNPESGEEKGILTISIYANGHKTYTAEKMWKPGNYHIQAYGSEESAIEYIMK